MKRSTFFILVPMALCMAALLALGNWQVQRLHWKEDLIAIVKQRMNEPPASLTEIETLWDTQRDVNFVPFAVEGVFEHSKEQFYYVTKNGTVGWHVYVPLTLSDGRVLIVNRGFVPDAFKDQQLRLKGLPHGNQTIQGLARNAPSVKPNSFVPNNDLQKNIYHWRSLSQMAGQMADKTEVTFLPFFMDAGLEPETGPFPHGGSTRISFPNNHLQYAITWYGLALALLGVGSYFLYQRRKTQSEKSIKNG